MKSAEFIQDSDEEYGNMEAFLEQEKEKRLRMEKLTTEGGGEGTGLRPMMKSTGTKKRRKKQQQQEGATKENGRRGKRRKGVDGSPQAADEVESAVRAELSSASDTDAAEESALATVTYTSRRRDTTPSEAATDSSSSPAKPTARPRPKPRFKAAPKKKNTFDDDDTVEDQADLGFQSRPVNGDSDAFENDPLEMKNVTTQSKKKGRLILSDDEDDE
jgi:replication fork protection complex subunit Tof1/Swi1